MLRWIGTWAVMALVAGGVCGGMLIVLPSVMPVVAGLGAASSVPTQINHQGVVAVDGVRFAGNGQFKFAIVDPDTGNNVWTNDGSKIVPPTQTGEPSSGLTLTVAAGVYSVALGASPMAAISPSLFADGNLVLRVWFNDGTHNWQQLSPDQPLTSVPYAYRAVDAGIAGEIKMWSGAANNLPTGWLACDGSAVSRTTYAGLFGVIGTTYGNGDGSTSFNLPDMRGRIPVGLGTNTDVDALGDSDGLTVSSRRPTHVHAVAGHKHGKGSLSISGGSHRHGLTLMNDGCMSGCIGWGAADQAARSTGGGADATSFFTQNGTHTHPNSEFSGVVGLTAGVDGDAGFNSSAAGPAYLTINYIVKY